MISLDNFLSQVKIEITDQEVLDLMNSVLHTFSERDRSLYLRSPISDEQVVWYALQVISYIVTVANINVASEANIASTLVEPAKKLLGQILNKSLALQIPLDEDGFIELIESIEAYSEGGLYTMDQGLERLGIGPKNVL